MAYNFLACDRDQAFLLPPDVRDWLPADHLAWFVLDVVDQLDLGPFLAAYRADGHGRAAYQPRMLLAVLLYAYCTGVRSSRQIERRCLEDIAFRVLSGNRAPDHVTIARFRVRHEQALAGLLIQSLKLCAGAGMVRVGLIALDGTKVEANAAAAANRTHAHLEAQVAELGAAARARGQRPAPTSDLDGAMRHPTPRRPSTTLTPTAGSCAATAAPCRATTPRRPPPPPRWWSPLNYPAGQRPPTAGPDACRHPHHPGRRWHR